MAAQAPYDVVIVGSGHAGAYMAHQLGLQKKRVLIIEGGPTTQRNREDYMENFYLNMFKAPESPYPPNANGLNPGKTNTPRPTIPELVEAWNDPSQAYLTYTNGSLPFASTYERVAGGTGNHWMGTTLRMTLNDFNIQTLYKHGLDWPIDYGDIEDNYAMAEAFIGVSANVKDQIPTKTDFPTGYEYPMPGIPLSLSDNAIKKAVDGAPLTNEMYAINQTLVTPTPAGRNSVPYDNRRACHGNTNCTPICPIQAKYDAAYALQKALSTGFVDIIYQAVVDVVRVDAANKVTGVHYLIYESTAVPATSGRTGEGVAVGKLYVLAASAIENAKILLNSPTSGPHTVANGKDLVGRHLMDHPTYLIWGLMPPGKNLYGYRGPISTAGIETLRDGAFRGDRSAWRIEIGNEAWNWPANDPYATGMDFIYGTNGGGLNTGGEILGNSDYVKRVNDLLTRQFRCAFLVEQDADPNNRVQLSGSGTPIYFDNLGLRRPLLTYKLSEWVMKGFQQARIAQKELMLRLKATDYTATDATQGTTFSYGGQSYNYAGAGHTCGTHIMGPDANKSVVDSFQLSWENPNLYIVGCGSMPSIGTQNPTLTMVALADRTTRQIVQRL